MRADLATGQVAATLSFRAPLSERTQAEVTIQDPQARQAKRLNVWIEAYRHTKAVDVTLDHVEPWSPDHPCLYTITARLTRRDEVLDEWSETFGFRSIEARDGVFWLNGKRLYLRGALDQDYYPETICSPPSEAFLVDQFRKAKELGLNCLRLHIKAPDPLYYRVADRIGILVWAELPNGGLTTERSRKRKERLLKGIVDRDGNHPCIVIWTIVNENWGVDLVHDAEHRVWLKSTYHWLKAYDPGRLVVDNSPLAPSFHVATDIADYHFYAAIPDNRGAWNAFVDKLASTRAWLFSPNGDATITGSEPRLCSEFGNWGLPDPADLSSPDGREPWWFESGHDWADGVMYPHGIQQRFYDWSLDRVFGSVRGFVEAAQWQQYRALKYQIEEMRRRPELSGYVITELTDVHWEANGLLDMNRNPRVFHAIFSRINADIVVLPEWSRLAVWQDRSVSLNVAIANGGSERLPEGCRLVVSGGQAKFAPIGSVDAGAVLRLGRVDVEGLRPAAVEPRRIELELRAPDGRRIASNHVDVAVHPEWTPAVDLPKIFAASADTQAFLAALGYSLVARPQDAQCVLAREMDATSLDHVRQGGAVLLLPDRDLTLQPLFPHWQNVRVQERTDSVWQGDWASSFAWLRRSGPFARLPGAPLLDETFDRVIPTHVISGCNLIDFQARVHAGIVVGWIHRPAALVVERGYGQGRVVASTFRLFRDPPGDDPTATILLAVLIELAAKRRSTIMRPEPRP